MSMARSLVRSIVRPLPAAITGLSGGGGGSDAYAANDISPDLAVDFNGSLNSGTPFYRKQGATTTLDAVNLPEPDGLRTMTDSSGGLVWNAHNGALESDDLSGWTNFSTSDSGNVVTCGAGTSAHIIYTDANAVVGQTRTIAANISKGNWDYISVTLQGNTNHYITVIADLDGEIISQTAVGSTSGTLISSSLASNADGSYTVRLRGSVDGVAINRLVVGFAEASTGNTLTSGGNVDWQSAAAGTETVSVNAGWSYRSDLGGMADVPSAYRGISYEADYLPTTTTARYLPRFGHHTYSGSAWVDKGVFVERVASTQLGESPEDMSGYGTVGGSSPSPTKNAVGIDGVANSATTLTDNDGAGYEALFQEGAIADSSNPVLCQCFVRYSASPSAYPALVNWRRDGTQVLSGIVFDPSDGSYVTRAGDTAPDEVYVRRWSADYWYVGIVADNNGTGNTTGRFIMYPAWNADGTATGDTSATGSNVFHLPNIYDNQAVPVSPIPDASTARTADPALTVAAADAPYSASGLSLAVIGEVTYADQGSLSQMTIADRRIDSNNTVQLTLNTSTGGTGSSRAAMRQGGGTVPSGIGPVSAVSPGVDSAFAFAARYIDSGGTVQSAASGSAGSEATGANGLPDVSSEDMDIAADSFMGTVSRIVGWAEDIAEAGIEQAATEDNTAP